MKLIQINQTYDTYVLVVVLLAVLTKGTLKYHVPL